MKLIYNEIGIYGQFRIWFMSFVSSRTYSVKINSSLSPAYVNIHGVPRGSFLSSRLFIIYNLPIKSIFHKYPNIHYHLYSVNLYIRHFLLLVILILFKCLCLIVLLISPNGYLITLYL